MAYFHKFHTRNPSIERPSLEIPQILPVSVSFGRILDFSSTVRVDLGWVEGGGRLVQPGSQARGKRTKNRPLIASESRLPQAPDKSWDLLL